MQKMFAFDLDGTVTLEETLPLLARELGLMEEMELLTRLAMEGRVAFDQSLRMRVHILREIPLQDIRRIMTEVRIDARIEAFIRERVEECAIVTGNLDAWVQPLTERLGCQWYSSTSRWDDGGILQLDRVLDKGETVREMKRQGFFVIAIGEGFNDIPMFREADVSIAYGGVHPPVEAAISMADYFVQDGEALCRLLEGL